MIKNSELLRAFEDKLISNQHLTHTQAWMLLDSLWQEGVSLGVLPPKDPMEGIEVDIQVAAIVNTCLKNS